MTGKGETFKCAVCKDTFVKGRSDEEAMDEALDLYPPQDLAAGYDEVCDDCFEKVKTWLHDEHPEGLREGNR